MEAKQKLSIKGILAWNFYCRLASLNFSLLNLTVKVCALLKNFSVKSQQIWRRLLNRLMQFWGAFWCALARHTLTASQLMTQERYALEVSGIEWRIRSFAGQATQWKMASTRVTRKGHNCIGCWCRASRNQVSGGAVPCEEAACLPLKPYLIYISPFTNHQQQPIIIMIVQWKAAFSFGFSRLKTAKCVCLLNALQEHYPA